MEIRINKKYTLEINRNKSGLWYKTRKDYPEFVYNKHDITMSDELDSYWTQYEKHANGGLVPVYFSYDVGIRKQDLASVTLSVLRILTIFNFQFRLYSNGYLYKETALSRRFKHMIGQSKLRSDEVTKMLSKKEYKRFAKELRENILTQ